MDCYRLAREYHVDPSVFLQKPISEIDRHMYWTRRVLDAIDDEQQWAMRVGNA